MTKQELIQEVRGEISRNKQIEDNQWKSDETRASARIAISNLYIALAKLMANSM